MELERRLDQRDEPCRRGEQPRVDLGDRVGDRQVGQVHRDQVHGLADQVRAQPGQVGVFQVVHPRVSAQPPAELADTGIDGVDTGRPGIQQGLGEAAGRCAQVKRDDTGRVDLERGQRVGQLDHPAQPAGLAYPDGGVRAHTRPRAGRRHAVDQDRAVGDQPGGIFQAGKSVLEQSEQRDERDAPDRGHGKVLLALGPVGTGPSGQGGPRAARERQPPCPRTPRRPQPTAAARRCAVS